MNITNENVEKVLSELEIPAGTELFGPQGLIKQITKRLVEKALEAEMDEHLGYKKGERALSPRVNTRNGKSQKHLTTDSGEIAVEVPRDRECSFEPKFVKKRPIRLDGFDDAELSMYSRGMSTRDIQGDLFDLYGTEVSPDLISRVTDAVLEDVQE